MSGHYHDRNADLVRALGYTSTDNAAFQKLLANRIRTQGPELKQEFLTACGWCLRDPEHIALFAESFLQSLRNEIRGKNNWLKAFGEMLRYRDDATRDIESDSCEELTQYILQILDDQRRSGQAQFLFRNSCLCLAFLLRRRAFDDDFLRPQSVGYEKVRKVFQSAIHGYGALRSIGGAINPRGILKTMTKYLDRMGPPILRGGIELRSLVE